MNIESEGDSSFINALQGTRQHILKKLYDKFTEQL